MSNIRSKLKEIEEKVDIYLSVNRYRAAEDLVHDSLDMLGEVAKLRNLLGLVYHKQSKFSQAIQQFQKSLQINCEYIEPSLNLAITYCDLGLYQKGEKQYLEITNDYVGKGSNEIPSLFKGRLANLHCETADYYRKSGLNLEAIKEYEKALSIYPKMPDKVLELARLEYDMNHLEKAKVRLQDFAEAFSPSTLAYNLLGLIAYKEGDYSSSYNYWAKSQEIDPSDRTSRSLLRCLRETPDPA